MTMSRHEIGAFEGPARDADKAIHSSIAISRTAWLAIYNIGHQNRAATLSGTQLLIGVTTEKLIGWSAR